MFTIEIDYTTGDSFGSERTKETIDHEWYSLDIAKKNLLRLKNYQDFVEKHTDIYTKPECEIPEGVIWEDKYRVLLFEVVTDSGDTITISPFWNGYFETIHSAEIISVGYSDIKIIFG